MRKHKIRKYATSILGTWVVILTCQDPNKVILDLSSYNLNDHEKSVLCKGFRFAIPAKTVFSEFLPPFETLFREIANLEVSNFDKYCVKSRLRAYTHHLGRSPRFLRKIFPERRLKH